jgi:hypothetical protein
MGTMWRGGAGLVGVLLAFPALAAAPSSIAVDSDGCPDAASVSVELQALLPAARIGDDASAIRVQIHDDGERYRIRAAGMERTLSDPKRRCADRAHAAAVVIALVLAPPELDEQQPPPPSPLAPRRPTVFVDLAANGRLELAPDLSSGGLERTGGGELRLEVGWRFVAASLGIRGLAPARQTFGAVGAQLTRVPIDLGARFAWLRRRVELSGLVGLTAAALRIEGLGLAPSLSETRWDLAAHVVLAVRFWITRRVGIEALSGLDVSFRTINLVVDPVGVVGKTPRLWIGFGVGPVFRLRNSERQ